MIEFGILGPLAAVADGEDVTPGAGRERALLAALIARANRVVSVDRLASDLGGEALDAESVRVYVSRLRKTLRAAGAADLIETRAGGYLLAVVPDTIDAVRFETLVASGRAAASEGNAAEASRLLTEALALWRGAAFGELASTPFISGDAARLEEERLAALEDRVEADLACGKHSELAGELEELCGENPLRERLWGQRIVALYRGGRQAEALRAYQQLRTTLAEELGIEPSVELRELERSVLQQGDELRHTAPHQPSPSPIEPQAPSGVVTFLLTDIVESTAMWDRASRAMATALARHDAILRGLMDTYGGVLLKARGEGDSTFSVFRRATDAVAAARGAQMALGSEPWPEGAELRVRIALHTGEAYERDGDYFGPAVNRVSRLRELAGPGEVLCSAVTAELVADHLEDVTLEEVGTQRLRDLARPEHVFRLVAAPRGATPPTPTVRAPIPLPKRLAAAPMPGFHGRTAELDTVNARLKAAGEGERSVVFVAGEPGIGKTSLAAHVAQAANAGGAAVLYGRCDEDLGIPYQPWAEALTHLVTHAPASLVERLAPGHLTQLARLVPSLADRIARSRSLTRGDPEAERYRLFGAVIAVLEAATASAPVVIVLDDLHWADTPTLLLFRHILASPTPAALVIIATYREGELPPTHPLRGLVAELRRERHVDRLALHGLADQELLGMVEALGGQALEGSELAFVQALHRETDGNPFFAWEILMHLAETGAISRDDDGRWVVNLEPGNDALPDSVREVIVRRVLRLGEPVERALSMAAVIGREFSLDVLASALGTDPDEVVESLDRAEQAVLVNTLAVGQYSFVHALIATTLAAGLTATRRARSHQRVAETMEALGLVEGHEPELARHWSSALSTEGTVRAIEYSRIAGERALAALAPDEALRWYGRALEQVVHQPFPDEHLRCELLLGYGRAQREGGDPAYRQTLLDAAQLAQHLGDDDRLVQAALANSRGLGVANPVDDERVAVLEATLDRVGSDDSQVRARLLARLGIEEMVAGDFDHRSVVINEALDMARRLGDPATLLEVLNAWVPAMAVPELLHERSIATAEAVALSARLGEPVANFFANQHRAQLAIELADVADADRCLDRMQAIADEVHQPTLRWICVWTRCSRALLAGDTEAAERLTNEAFELGSATGQPDAMIFWGGQLYAIRWHQGRDRELFELLQQMLDESPNLPVLKAGVSRALWESGRGDEVRIDLDELKALPRDLTWSLGMVMWSEVAVRAGEREAAQFLYDSLASFGESVVYVQALCAGSVAHYLGMLATLLERQDDAVGYFETAAALHDKLQAPFHQARTAVEWARCLLALGDESDVAAARAHLHRALELAQRFGCAEVERRAKELLGVTPTA